MVHAGGYRTLFDPPGCHVYFGMGYALLLATTILSALTASTVRRPVKMVEKDQRRAERAAREARREAQAEEEELMRRKKFLVGG